MSEPATMIQPESTFVTHTENSERRWDEAPPLTMEGMFFPLGFPLCVRSNSEEVLRQCAAKWGMFTQRTNDHPIEVEIYVIECDSDECPPPPIRHFMGNTFLMAANSQNICTVDYPWGKTRMIVTSAALKHPRYFDQTFLETAPACQMCTRFATNIHAGCVALDGHGVLLCGESGAGKTTLSYGCALAGWQFVADDSCYILHRERDRRVVGNCHSVRFRASAAQLFSELAGAELTPRMSGKPTIELPTASLDIRTTEGTYVDYVVFINRWQSDSVDLVPYSKDAARQYMRQVLFGEPETKDIRFAAVERLLSAEVLELRYKHLDSGIRRLENLVREGH